MTTTDLPEQCPKCDRTAADMSQGGPGCLNVWHEKDRKRLAQPPIDPLQHQVGGSHYQGVSLQPLDVIRAWGLDFVAGNVLKYLFRAGRKGGYAGAVEDVDKAIHYLQIMRADFVDMNGEAR